MFRMFLSHQWKEMTRSNFWQKSLILNIVIGFVLLIMFSYLIMIGLFIDEIFKDIYPDSDPFVIFNKGIIYYLGIDLFIRFFMYSLPVINIESYLHLPVKRTKILSFILLKSSLNLFNVLPLLVFIPFALKVIVVNYTGIHAIKWICLMFILILNNSFLLHYIKRRFIDKPYISAIFAILLVGTFLLDKFGVIGLSGSSSDIIIYLVNNPVFILAPVLVLLIVIGINYSYLKSRLTIEDVNVKKEKKLDSLSGLKYFDSFGDIGEMILLEIKLIWRNKRSKSIVNMSPLFIFYGLIFYPQEIYSDGFAIFIFVGMFMTGTFMFNYGQYMLSWESTYFDGILANNVDYEKHFKSKYYLMVATAVIFYLLTLPYAYFGMKVVLINTATFLFNLGFLTYLLLYVSTYSRKRMDMTKGSAFNYQGLGASNWLMVLPFFALPILIWLPFNLMGVPYWGIGAIGFVGVLSMVFHKTFMKIVIKKFEKEKYKIAQGFREL